MLYVLLLNSKVPATEALARRLEWQYPEGVKLVGEFWPMAQRPAVISVFEADTIAPMMSMLATWSDQFEFTIFPAVTAEEGIKMGRMMGQKAQHSL